MRIVKRLQQLIPLGKYTEINNMNVLAWGVHPRLTCDRGSRSPTPSVMGGMVPTEHSTVAYGTSPHMYPRYQL